MWFHREKDLEDEGTSLVSLVYCVPVNLLYLYGNASVVCLETIRRTRMAQHMLTRQSNLPYHTKLTFELISIFTERTLVIVKEFYFYNNDSMRQINWSVDFSPTKCETPERYSSSSMTETRLSFREINYMSQPTRKPHKES